MRKILFLLLLISLVSVYVFSAMHSLHQVHKSIYYDNKQLSKDYVEWEKIKTNVREYINVRLTNELSKDENFKTTGEIGFLIAGLTEKFVEQAVDIYINPEGLSFLLKNSSKSLKIPEPSFGTLFAGISLMKFNSFGSFHVDLESGGETIPVHFRRIGFKWKVEQIDFSDDLINKLIHY